MSDIAIAEAIDQSLSERLDRLIESPPTEVEDYLLRTDLAYFAERILGMEIVDHHIEWSKLTHNHKKLALNAPRDHGKSFFFCFAYAIWRAYYAWIPPKDPTMKSLPRVPQGYIFSNTQEQAIAHLEIIKTEIESNPLLEHLLPEKQGKGSWSKKEIKLANGAMIRAKSWGSGVRGAHPCWIVCDDVLSEENLYSELIRGKERDYLFSAVTPMLIPNGQMVVVGTPFHNDDLYHHLEANSQYHFKRYQALNTQMDRALWPTRYTVDMLLNRREEVGSTRFTREYMCVPVSDDNSLFPHKILRPCFDAEFEMPTYLTKEERAEINVFTGVDLALSTHVGADFTVITTIAIDEHRNMWILDIRRKRGMGMTEQLREIEDVYRTYRPDKILIEDNAFQRVFADELVKNTDMPVQGFTTTRHNKHSVEKGVPSLQIMFENKKFVIPRKTERCRNITDVLVHELQCFTWVDGKLEGVGTHDDCVMSLWMAKEAAQSSSFTFTFA